MLHTFHSNLGWNIWLLSPQHIRIRVARTLEWGDVMEVYSCGNRQLFTLDQAHVMTIATSPKFVPNAYVWYHLVILVIKLKPISKWIMPNWAFHTYFNPFSNGSCQIGPLIPTMAIKVDFGFIQRIYYLFEASREFLTYVSFIIPYW